MFILGCTQRECQTSKDTVDKYRNMFESKISAGALENISSWSYDMEGRAKKCVENIANWRIKRRNNYKKSQHHEWMTINVMKKKLDQLENCQSMLTDCFEMSTFGSYW